MPCLKLKIRNFVMNIFAKTKKVCKTVLACSYGAKTESFDQQKSVKNLMTLSL